MEPLALSYEWLVFLIFWSRMNYLESRIDCALRHHIRRAPRDGWAWSRIGQGAADLGKPPDLDSA